MWKTNPEWDECAFPTWLQTIKPINKPLSDAHLCRRHWRHSRCRCPGKHVLSSRSVGSPGNTRNGPRVRQRTWSQTWFREQGLPERGRWWELWERRREGEHERNASHMWSKPADILWHSLPGDIHVSLGSGQISWEKGRLEGPSRRPGERFNLSQVHQQPNVSGWHALRGQTLA